jgi:hypothetical protein
MDPDPGGPKNMWIRNTAFNNLANAKFAKCKIRIQEGKMTHKNRKKFINFIFGSAGCYLLRSECFSCSF